MADHPASEAYQIKERARESMADETYQFWKKAGWLNHYHMNDYYRIKEKIMQCLSDVGAP